MDTSSETVLCAKTVRFSPMIPGIPVSNVTVYSRVSSIFVSVSFSVSGSGDTIEQDTTIYARWDRYRRSSEMLRYTLPSPSVHKALNFRIKVFPMSQMPHLHPLCVRQIRMEIQKR